MAVSLNRILHGIGSLLAIAGLVMVVVRLRDYGAEIDFSRFNASLWSGITVLALIYALVNLALALAWWSLLTELGARTTCRWAVRTYGISQLAKYVPGNIFHLAGRQALGMAPGIPGFALVKSSVWELGLIALAGALFGVLVLPLVLTPLTMSLTAGALVVVAAFLVIGVRYWAGENAARAFVLYLGFHVVSGAIFVGLIGLLTNDWYSLPWVGAGASYVVAWLIGMLTPGAPAGVGVRELVLLFLLKNVAAEAELLLAVVLGRLVTVVGDLVFFFLHF
ncbi:MAG: hypothetical protein ACTSX7_20120 [Alphaproteobacteria bacterium]